MLFDADLFLAKRSKVSKTTVKAYGKSVALEGRPAAETDAALANLAAAQPEIDDKGKGGVRITTKFETASGKETTVRDTITPEDGSLFLSAKMPPEKGKKDKENQPAVEDRLNAPAPSPNGHS